MKVIIKKILEMYCYRQMKSRVMAKASSKH